MNKQKFSDWQLRQSCLFTFAKKILEQIVSAEHKTHINHTHSSSNQSLLAQLIYVGTVENHDKKMVKKTRHTFCKNHGSLYSC